MIALLKYIFCNYEFRMKRTNLCRKNEQTAGETHVVS